MLWWVTEGLIPGSHVRRRQGRLGVATRENIETKWEEWKRIPLVTTDEVFMREALDLAMLGKGRTAPNPTVGCIVVASNGTVIGRGFHPAAGQAHAEIYALRDAGAILERRDDDGAVRWDVSNTGAIANSTIYVTLEPCSHVGRTPPCCDALVDAGVKRVVIGIPDPAPWVSGRGINRLRANGVQVDVGVEAQLCAAMNADWIKNLTAG